MKTLLLAAIVVLTFSTRFCGLETKDAWAAEDSNVETDVNFQFGPNDFIIGVYETDYETAVKTIRFPLTISIINGDKEITMQIKNSASMPLHSVKVDCPGGNMQKAQCYFIMYGKEGE